MNTLHTFCIGILNDKVIKKINKKSHKFRGNKYQYFCNKVLKTYSTSILNIRDICIYCW